MTRWDQLEQELREAGHLRFTLFQVYRGPVGEHRGCSSLALGLRCLWEQGRLFRWSPRRAVWLTFEEWGEDATKGQLAEYRWTDLPPIFEK